MKLIYALFMTALFTGNVWAQEASLPRVFILGEDEKTYEELTQSYSQTLLEAADNDIKIAFNNWLDMMSEIDKYARKVKYDINGVKLWLHVFWGENGEIDHIGYLLRPESRHVKDVELRAFFSSFMRKYTFPQKSTKKFNHYTGATFPTFIIRAN